MSLHFYIKSVHFGLKRNNLFYTVNEIIQQYVITRYFSKDVWIKKIVITLVMLCFVWVSIPRISNFTYYKFITPKAYINGLYLKKPEIILPANMKQTMGNDPRVLYIYGWGTPYFYYFSHTKPFSRFFILHPNILGEQQIQEFVKQFKTELPKVVLYTEVYSDMDTQEFENNNILFKKLLEKCYAFYPSNQFDKFHCKGYYLLKDETYFKEHLQEFIALKHLSSQRIK